MMCRNWSMAAEEIACSTAWASNVAEQDCRQGVPYVWMVPFSRGRLIPHEIEVMTIAASPRRQPIGPTSAGRRVTVTLIPAAEADLRQLQERTGLSTTDLVNRAITTYAFFDAQLRAGHDIVTRNNRTGETRLVRLL
jgi:hypothetical protein